MSPERKKFGKLYTKWKRDNRVEYVAAEFLYRHAGPWPQAAFDQPYAQAPVVLHIPPDEQADWDQVIGTYYAQHTRDYMTEAIAYAGKSLVASAAKGGLNGYSDVPDELFAQLICEGLYSKYLCELDEADHGLFKEHLVDKDNFEYLKSDYSCMKAVGQPWGWGSDEHERHHGETPSPQYVAPTIVLVRRPKPTENFDWECVAIAVCKYEEIRNNELMDWTKFAEDLIFTPKCSAWWLAKLFALQGAVHRINLVEHAKVHFPSDTVNAVTKTVLPRWHWLQKLLLPHFRLTLPVNNAVLEGDRSLINRETWYPWGPFSACGDEIRRLLKYSWMGATDGNSAYPGYWFSLDPDHTSNADNPDKAINTFIGLKASRYGEFLRSYFDTILAFTTSIVQAMPTGDEPDRPRDDKVELGWLEVQNWAQHVADFLPGFPGPDRILEDGVLARSLAMVIWNAAVVHSADHLLLHQMFEQNGKVPIPFIMRVPPPKTVKETPKGSFGKTIRTGQGATDLMKNLQALRDSPRWKMVLSDDMRMEVIKAGAWLMGEQDVLQNVPLCWPADTVYARMADLMFYKPHNATTLYTTKYAWVDDEQMVRRWPESKSRPRIDDRFAAKLDLLVKKYQDQLRATDEVYFDTAGRPIKWDAKSLPLLKLPRLQAPDEPSADRVRFETEECFAAGIQY